MAAGGGVEPQGLLGPAESDSVLDALIPFNASLQALLQGVGPEGAVYASMGTLCNFGPNEFVAIGQALSALPNQVIWKLAPGDLPGNATVDSLNLASNIKVST